MGLDQLLELTSQVAGKVLPILGVIVLIFLAIFVKHLIRVMKSADKALQAMGQTLDTTNRQLEALDKPINTLNELSETVDVVHDASKNAVRSVIVTVIENFSSIKDWIASIANKDKHTDETAQDQEGEQS